MFSAFAAAPPAGLSARTSIQGSGSLVRQLSGSLLRTQGSLGSGVLRTQGSGAVTAAWRPVAPVRAAGTDGVAPVQPGGDAPEPQHGQLGLGLPHPEALLHPEAPLPPHLAAQHAAAQAAHHQQRLSPFAAQQQRQQPTGPQGAASDIEALLESSVEGLSTPQFDTYALRHLVHAPPAEAAHLSSLAVNPDRVVRRYAVTAATGERSVMTLTFERTPGDAAAPTAGTAAPVAPPPTLPLRAAATAVPAAPGAWALTGATGEPADAALPLRPSPEHPPEAVVEAQLEALRSLDAFTAWRFISLGGRAAYGGAADGFYAALEGPELVALLMHAGCERVMRRQPAAGVYTEVVRVEVVEGVWQEFCWTLSLQREGPFEGCWMVESLRPGANGGVPPAGDFSRAL